MGFTMPKCPKCMNGEEVCIKWELPDRICYKHKKCGYEWIVRT